MLFAFERTSQSHRGLLWIFVLEQLDTLPKLNHRIELYCALGSLRCKCEVHGGPQVLHVDYVLT